MADEVRSRWRRCTDTIKAQGAGTNIGLEGSFGLAKRYREEISATHSPTSMIGDDTGSIRSYLLHLDQCHDEWPFRQRHHYRNDDHNTIGAVMTYLMVQAAITLSWSMVPVKGSISDDGGADTDTIKAQGACTTSA